MAFLTKDDSGLIQLWQNYPNKVNGIWQAWIEKGVNNEIGLDVTGCDCFRELFKGRVNTNEPLTLIISTFTERKYYTATEAAYKADMSNKAEILEQLNEIYDKLDRAVKENIREVTIYKPILKGVENILRKKGFTVIKRADNEDILNPSMTVTIQFSNPKEVIKDNNEITADLNTAVSVVLTKVGASAINAKNADICIYAKYPVLKTDYKEDDIYEGALWQVLGVFADSIRAHADKPFKSIKFSN